MIEVRRPASRTYVPVRFFATDLRYATVQETETLPADELGDVTFRWDWRFVEGEFMDVLLGVTLAATRGRLEEVEVSMVGSFRLPTETPDVSLETFATLNGPAMLMPYLREAISALTSRGYFGAFTMPPINVHHLIAGMDQNATGVRQAAADPALATLMARLTLKQASQPTRQKKRARKPVAKAMPS
ncbi:MAG: protein-export chaperone SecB [Gemmatimonadaceae bacterium]